MFNPNPNPPSAEYARFVLGFEAFEPFEAFEAFEGRRSKRGLRSPFN